MDPLSILHVSDLHREPAHEVTNKALLNSLEQDRDKYRNETPRVPDPNLIIVSGDIVHGVKHDSADAEKELQRQYEQAEAFLVELTQRFVGGDRERVVIIPGNHDVSFYHTHQSMKRITVDLSTIKGKAAAVTNANRLWGEERVMRWSWSEFCFYEINDRAVYDSRLGAFCEFYGRFYQGKRKYSLKPEEQFEIFDYPDYRMTIVGFSSCHDNDPRNKKGGIHPDCIAEACLQLRAPQYRGRTLLATWHHNTAGGPSQSDYMDADILQVLIDGGFSIGFHGHQHKTQFIEEKYQFGGGRKITVISAGTLCAGPKEIPTGQARAYNVLEFDTKAKKATLHQRKMHNSSFGNVIWGPGQFASTNQPYITFDVQPPIERNHVAEDAKVIGSAEELLRTGNARGAASLVKAIAPHNLLAKKILWECYVALDDRRSMVAEFYPPSTPAEIIHIAHALWEEDERGRLKDLLGLAIVANSTDMAVIDIREKYKVRLGL